MLEVRKIVLPAAGRGKRLRPLTLRTPKALVEVGGKPIVEYTLEEAQRSGLLDVIFIISPDHQLHFDRYLKKAEIKFPDLNFQVRVQKEPLGNGHALLSAKDLIGDDPFVVRFCDDIIFDEEPVSRTLVSFFRKRKSPIFLLERVPEGSVSSYGVIGGEKDGSDDRLYRVYKIIEKPKTEEAPSNLTIVGGYVLTRKILDHLEDLSKSMAQVDDGLLLTDAFNEELKENGTLYGLEFSGKRFDCGTLDGLKKAEGFLSSLA